jgi:hypothetical protein
VANKRKCRHCKNYFHREDGIIVPVGFYCCIEHAREHTRPKAKAITIKRNKIAKEATKERLKTKTEWLDELQTLVNKYVRFRDADNGCISCDKDKHWTGQWHCSHYVSRGASAFLRFNLWNMHKSCSACNGHKSGNICEYTPKLIDKIGQEKYDWLMSNKSNVVRYDVDYIKRAKVIVRKAIKRIIIK